VFESQGKSILQTSHFERVCLVHFEEQTALFDHVCNAYIKTWSGLHIW